jgi:hypothetical protein
MTPSPDRDFLSVIQTAVFRFFTGYGSFLHAYSLPEACPIPVRISIFPDPSSIFLPENTKFCKHAHENTQQALDENPTIRYNIG